MARKKSDKDPFISIKGLKEQHLFKMDIFSYIINVFNDTFD